MYQKRNNILEVIALYRLNYKSAFFLRQISRLSGIPLKTCQNLLSYLLSNKILKSRIDGKNKYFSLNLDNIQVKSYLLQSEIYKTDEFLDHYPQIKTFMKSLSANTTIIVFGSYAKAATNKDSDLDLLIIGEEKLPFHLMPFRIHEIRMTEESFIKAKEETLIKEIDENHLVLNNHSFFVNTMWDKYAK